MKHVNNLIMTQIYVTLLRILFLGTMCFWAYQNYFNAEKSTTFFIMRHSTFEYTLMNRFAVKLPNNLTS